MDAEDIEMGEWYRCGTQQRGEEFTPLSLYIDPHGEMAFRRDRDGGTYLFSVSEMEPVPKPVVYPELWILIDDNRAYWDDFDSLAEAMLTARAVGGVGVLHLRTDGTTEMLEIES